jgi:hypothetical protein
MAVGHRKAGAFTCADHRAEFAYGKSTLCGISCSPRWASAETVNRASVLWWVRGLGSPVAFYLAAAGVNHRHRR